MNATAAATLGLWLIASVLSLWVWLPTGIGPAAARRQSRRARVAVLAGLVLVAGLCALLTIASPPVTGPWRWLAGLLGAAVTVLGGGALTTSILALATSATSTARVQRDVLRGGAWIGALERLALLGTLVAGWPEGLAVIVAVKGLARYPELRTASTTGSGANERFIIGTFASLGWAATCAWMITRLL